MTKQEMRLELVRLTYHPTRSTQDAIGRAKHLEEYVVGPEAETQALPAPQGEVPAKRRRAPRKSTDNAIFG